MEKEFAKIKWDDGMSFTTETEGYKMVIDSHPDFGGKNKGPKPKPFLLTALGGCTSMDVVSMLNKMRVKFDDFNVNVEGELTNEHPKHYSKIWITYEFFGDDVSPEKVKKAVNMSEEKYCGVNYMLGKAADIKSIIKINGEKLD